MWDQRETTGRVNRFLHDIHQKWRCLIYLIGRIQPHGQKENMQRQLVESNFVLLINLNIFIFPFIDTDFSLVRSFQWLRNASSTGLVWAEGSLGHPSLFALLGLNDSRPKQQPAMALASLSASSLVLDNISF